MLIDTISTDIGRISVSYVFTGPNMHLISLLLSLFHIVALWSKVNIVSRAKLFYELVFPSVTNSITQSQTQNCFPFIIQNNGYGLSLCDKKC